jgi:hypothetical protein
MPRRFLSNAIVAMTAVLCVGTRYAADHPVDDASAAVTAPVRRAPLAAYVSAAAGEVAAPIVRRHVGGAYGVEVDAALASLGTAVVRLSHPRALEDAFRSYYAYRGARPAARLKPYLYFVDYGLPSNTPRGYVFDMEARRVVEGPFMVAHGRGSSAADGVPRRFSNAFGSATTSLGLFVAQELYAFRGKTAGHEYRSVGLRLAGVSGAYNSNARARGVVAHGAPYVTASRAGRSEGCPAVEPGRAERILPKLAHGGLVFLFAPDARWMAGDPWLAGRAG